jgi:predicted nucleic acid-binding protein
MSSQWTSRISRKNSNVAERAVVNASPLIFLARADLIDLLKLISPQVIVPEAVASEIEVRGKSDPTAQILANTSWLVVYSNASSPT